MFIVICATLAVLVNELAVKSFGAAKIIQILGVGQTIEDDAGHRGEKPVGMRRAAGDVRKGRLNPPVGKRSGMLTEWEGFGAAAAIPPYAAHVPRAITASASAANSDTLSENEIGAPFFSPRLPYLPALLWVWPPPPRVRSRLDVVRGNSHGFDDGFTGACNHRGLES